MAETHTSRASSGRGTKMSIDFIAPGAMATEPLNLMQESNSSSSWSPPRSMGQPPLQSSSSRSVPSQDSAKPPGGEVKWWDQHRVGLLTNTEPPSLPPPPTSHGLPSTSWSSRGSHLDYNSDLGQQHVRHSLFRIPPTPYRTNSSSMIHLANERLAGNNTIDHSISSNLNMLASASGNPDGHPDGNPDNTAPQTLARQRNPRPCYSEEQKFFIMHSRIVLAQTWPVIEARFLASFGQNSTRSKGGLTSVYYRIRKEWGLDDVLQSAAMDSAVEDQKVVASKAAHFSREVLMEIGYLS